MRFFRKIRQSLLTQSKFSKYLVYAVGEIVLVVIGILLAISIDNGNKERDTREKEQTYLVGLKEEFQTSKFKLGNLIEVNQRNFVGSKQLLEYIVNQENPPSERRFSSLLFATFSSDLSFNPNNSLLNEIMNSGSLKDFSNTDLRLRLTDWIATIEDVSKQEYDLALQREKTLDLFRTNETSLRTVLDLAGVSEDMGMQTAEQQSSNLKLLASRAFENNLLMFMLTTSATGEAHYEPLMKDLDTILALIEAEIR